MTRLTLDWLHLIVLLGAVHGVFLTGVLATKPSNRTANRLLAATMLAFSVGLATSVYHSAGLMESFPHFFGVGYPLPLLYGPLVYLYAVSAADRERRLTWRDALHFAPCGVVVLGGLPIYLHSGPEKIAFFHQIESGGARPLLLAVADPAKLVSGLIYATATIVFLRRHRDRVKDSYSSTDQVNLTWLLWLGGAAAAVWALAIGLNVAEMAGFARALREDDLVALAIAVMVYGIGYRGLRQPEIFRFETAEYPVPVPVPVTPALTEPEEPALADGTDAAAPRYERSGLTDLEARRLKHALTGLMDRDRPWHDSSLTLADLAGCLSTTPHKLSEVLNAQLGQTFYDFVNGYRVREVQRRIAAGDARQVTILALALEAGFASKSTFNFVFKKHTSQTPSDFQQAAGL